MSGLLRKAYAQLRRCPNQGDSFMCTGVVFYSRHDEGPERKHVSDLLINKSVYLWVDRNPFML